jgi:hypothetical protein
MVVAAGVVIIAAAAGTTAALLQGSPPPKASRPASASSVPALNRAAAQHVLSSFTATYNKANKLRSDTLLATIETGASYHMDAGSNRWYRVSSPGQKNWATVSLNGEALYIPLQPAGAYPRWFAARVTQTLQKTAPGPMYALFVQDSKKAPWKATYQDVILASPALEIALDKNGYAQQVRLDDARLSARPNSLATATAKFLDNGGAKVTDPWASGLADRSDQKFWKGHGFDPAHGATDSDIHFPAPNRAFGLKTASGGALVFYAVDAQLTLAMPDGQSFQLKIPGYYTYATSQTSAQVGYIDQFATYDPPHGTPSVIAESSSVDSRG